MNDEQYTPSLGTWLKDTDVTPPDPEARARQIMTGLPEREKRSTWWPFYRHTTSVARPMTDQTTQFQPTPIPDTNVHTPTVIGRTQSMFSPVKAITAGAIVFALGGVLFIAQPFDQQRGSVPGAETDAEFAAPTEFTATWDSNFGPPGLRPNVISRGSNILGPDLGRGYANHPLIIESAGDPRFEGVVTLVVNHDTYLSDGALRVFNTAFSVQNDEGTWRGVPQLSVRFSDAESSGATQLFIGEGGYAGSYALVDIQRGLAGQGWTLRGVIFEGEPPPAPEPFVSE